MSEYETDSDTNDVVDSFRDSFGCLPKVKANTPRGRFDTHFYPRRIELIQFSVKQEVSNRYSINRDNVIEMFRLPYSNGKQIFFVLHLKRPIVGGNRATTRYNFVVFNFAQDDYEEVTLDLNNPTVSDMFDEDIVESGTIAGPTAEIFETILTKIFANDATTPALNYDGNRVAPALRCTFWDNDEHFLYPLDDGFVNVWKYCQRLHLRDIKNVRFVRSQGRSKTFDYYIYPKLRRTIRRYHIGAGKSNSIDCFFLEFKAIDQDHYDGLFEYCNRHKITISTNDFRCDTDGSSDSESNGPTETNASDSDSSELIDDDFEAPDPYMAYLGGQKSDSHSGTTGTSEESTSTSEDELLEGRAATSPEVSCSSAQKRRSRRISRNVITDENSSSSDSIAAGTRKRKSFRIDSDDDLEDEHHNKVATKGNSLIDDDSEAD